MGAFKVDIGRRIVRIGRDPHETFLRDHRPSALLSLSLSGFKRSDFLGTLTFVTMNTFFHDSGITAITGYDIEFYGNPARHVTAVGPMLDVAVIGWKGMETFPSSDGKGSPMFSPR